MITKAAQVVGLSRPDITLETFTRVLEAASSPALVEGKQCYDAVVKLGVSPAFCLAIFAQESAFGTVGLAVPNKNAGNTRSSMTGMGIMVTTTKGVFIRYPNWMESFRDMSWRLVKPDHVYAQEGRKTIEQIITRWAPASDGNNTQAYINNVVKWMNQWIGSSTEVKPVAVTKPDIVWQGSPNFWVGRHSETVVAIVDHIMQGTMESSDGWFKNTNSQVSAHFGVAKDGRIWQWVSLSDAAWANGIPESPDMSIPWLAEAVNNGWNPNNRTVSIEHEGNTGEAMPEAQYQATLALHRWLMSQFPAITADRQHVIGHYQIMRYQRANCPGTGFPWARLMADLEKGVEVIMPTADTIQLNGHTLAHGFLDYYNKFGGARFFGLPLTDEYTNPQTGMTEMIFERYVLEFDAKETNPDWQVRGKIVGPGYLASRGF